MTKQVGIVTVHETKPGFDATIEVRGSVFNLRNAHDSENDFSFIDICDEDGKHLDEFASGFWITKEDEEYELSLVTVYEYIDNNLVF